MKTLVIAMQKGGSAKSTTAHAIGAGLAKRGGKVLFVDLDAQANLTFILQGSARFTALDVLTGKVDAATAATPLNTLPGAAIIAGTPHLAGADAKITGTRSERRLSDALKPIADKFNYCIIDTPPALGVLTVGAMIAADGVIIPCLADALSIQSLGQISQTVGAIRSTSNPRLQILGILLTRFTPRQVLARDAAATIERHAAEIGTRVFSTRIRESVSLREAQAMRMDIFTYAPRSAGAKDYNQLLEEIF